MNNKKIQAKSAINWGGWEYIPNRIIPFFRLKPKFSIYKRLKVVNMTANSLTEYALNLSIVKANGC